VGAAIAAGNHLVKGICALLVDATKIKIMNANKAVLIVPKKAEIVIQ
jgi:hypothetical protein